MPHVLYIARRPRLYGGEVMTDVGLKIHSDKAWEIALKYSYTLSSDTRTLAAHIDVALSEARATGRREGLSEAAEIAQHVDLFDGDKLKNSDPRETCAAAIRAAMEK